MQNKPRQELGALIVIVLLGKIDKYGICCGDFHSNTHFNPTCIILHACRITCAGPGSNCFSRGPHDGIGCVGELIRASASMAPGARSKIWAVTSAPNAAKPN